MSIIRRILYTRPVNVLMRHALRPFGAMMPEKARFPITGVIRVDLLNGHRIKIETNQTNALTRDVFWHGVKGYEYATLRIFMQLAQHARGFVDVGANIGYYSLIAAEMNPKMNIYAFEPMPSAYLYLQKNIALNGYSRIKPYKLAVASGPGTAEFFVTKNPKALHLEHHIAGSSTKARAKDRYSETIAVELVALDDWAQTEDIGVIDLMKLDTEATEDEVLRGARKMIEIHLPIIMCEVLPNRIENEIERLFQDFGYDFYLPVEDGLIKLNTVTGQQGEKDFFFVHPSKLHQIDSFLL